ncbi:MAG TPA: ribosome biogenesis GTPase Der [Caldilineales bacterium]|nr:ribosome biogenesis GTPase Der [Caldilineales bacterium]
MSRHKPKPIVALVGRPNVGKSTLFNRLIGRRQAIVEDLPGTTRDRLYGDAAWAGKSFIVVDTGGIEPLKERGGKVVSASYDPLAAASKGFVAEIRSQAELAIEEADVILFLVDAKEGLTAADEEVAAMLRDTDKPVILAANKADNAARRMNALEFYALGLGDPYPISAYHGTGTGDLLDVIVAHLPEAPVEEEEEEEALRIAIVGRPNVGKSSLLNALLGQERAIVSDIAGTTRDAVDTYLTWDGQKVILVDSAGIRRRGRIERGIEKYSVMRALRAIGRSDVVLLVLDATEGVTAQDAHIGGYILEEGRSLIIVVNKWDAIEKDTHTMAEYNRRLREELKFLDYVPALYVSALTRQRVNQIIPAALRVKAQRETRIPTGELNRLLQDAMAANPPKAFKGRQARFYYITQADIDPPTFVFFVNDPRAVHFTYERYLENRIRERFPFEGTPIRLKFKGKERKKG